MAEGAIVEVAVEVQVKVGVGAESVTMTVGGPYSTYFTTSAAAGPLSTPQIEPIITPTRPISATVSVTCGDLRLSSLIRSSSIDRFSIGKLSSSRPAMNNRGLWCYLYIINVRPCAPRTIESAHIAKTQSDSLAFVIVEDV